MNNINIDRASSIYEEEYLNAIQIFREIALEIDKNPSNIAKYYKYDNAFLANSAIFQTSCYDTVRSIEALAYGDVNVCMARPTTSLAGLLINELGDETQKNNFLNYCKENPSKTFFALTEPGRGSNILNLDTKSHLNKSNKFIINGSKAFIGGLAVGSIGVIITQAERNREFNIFMVTNDIINQVDEFNNPRFFRKRLDIVGLTAAGLGYAKFINLEIPSDNLLGKQLSSLKRGIVSVIKTFNRMRPSVAAMAVGLSQAIVDYHESINNSKGLNFFYKRLNLKIKLVRDNLYCVADKVDMSPYITAEVSEIKLLATQLLEEVYVACVEKSLYLFLEHPLMAKWYRDLLAFEFMEGASHIHKENVYLNILRSNNINLGSKHE